MTNTIETYKNEEGKIAVLVSYGFGAGWSSWYRNPAIAYDKRIIEYMLKYGSMSEFDNAIVRDEEKSRLSDFLNSIGYPNVYLGGAHGLGIEWVDPGQYFRIDEYDGSESLEILDPANQYIILY